MYRKENKKKIDDQLKFSAFKYIYKVLFYWDEESPLENSNAELQTGWL